MRCALWGGISLGVGTVAFALFSPSSVSCSTNVVVLTHSAVTARGCAAYSVVAHVGVGLIVLGAVLLLGSFALALRNRRVAGPSGVAGTTDAVLPERSAPAPTTPSPVVPTASSPVVPTTPSPVVPTTATPITSTAPIPSSAPTAPTGTPTPVAPGTPTPERVATGESVRAGPIPPGSEAPAWQGDGPGPLGSAVPLPPGWYGNPNTPGKPVQWWDGTKLIDRPG
jgi:hypothetical protein